MKRHSSLGDGPDRRRDFDVDIDRLYAEFVSGLPIALQRYARALPFHLGLVPEPDVPLRDTFRHRITLSAPALFAEAMDVDPTLVEAAVQAHMLAVIDAFGTDRILDGQVRAGRDLALVLAEVRAAREAAIARIGTDPSGLGYAEADATTEAAIARERAHFGNGGATTFREYEAIAADKQCVGLPASMALAAAAGWDRARIAAVRHILTDAYVGLQMNDDVVDWEDDLTRGGAWALSLARGELDGIAACHPRPDAARALVLSSGVLSSLLARAESRFRCARDRSVSLGLTSLAQWAHEREAAVAELREAEARHAGYAVRAHALHAWALEVLR